MTARAVLVGFDKASELLSLEEALPAHAWSGARRIATVPETDPNMAASYPLTESQVSELAEMAHISIDPTRFDYFLEARETSVV